MSNPVSYCRIRNNQIIKDGKVYFEDETAALDDFMDQAYSRLKVAYPKFYKMDRLSKLGFLASEILLDDIVKGPAANLALVLSNSSSSLDTDIRYWESAKTQPSPSLFVYTLPNIVAGEICIRHGIKGESIFFVTPEFDPVWTMSHADLLLSSGSTTLCVAGWVEVMDGHADVFLYLVEKPTTITAAIILELYHGSTDARPEKTNY